MNANEQNAASAALAARDLRVLWHPCTQMKDHETLPLVPIKRGEGAWLEDFDGRRYLDAVSSWWVNLFGHANPRISAALQHQATQLEHVIFAGFTHEPAIRLAEQLVALTPPGLTRCFFADNGSAAVEVAIKMSFHYWHNRGRNRKTRFMTLANSYHGETLGALAVGNVELYKSLYKPLLMDVLTAPSPDCYYREAGESWEQYSCGNSRRWSACWPPCRRTRRRHRRALGAMCRRHAHVSSGVPDAPARSLRRHDVHLIADEIAVGFGRTGTLFACEQAGITPDFLCLSKGLTGGYLPLSAVLTTDDMYSAFYDDYAKLTAFLHSHSYTGNPLACAVALATLDIFATDDVIARNRVKAAYLGTRARELAEHPNVAEVRQTGMIVAVEFAQRGSRSPTRGNSAAASASIGTRWSAACFCGPSAMWCTSCRPTSSMRNKWISWCGWLRKESSWPHAIDPRVCGYRAPLGRHRRTAARNRSACCQGAAGTDRRSNRDLQR
jgi:adenosylmethionine-8-amino-7-oxononanoate aminotransferase